jgi:hypothetical protein
VSVSTAPTSLSAQLFLLACDPDRQRLTQASDLGYVLRAAILAELSQDGLLSVRDGRVRASGSRRARDPLLTAVLREVEEGTPRTWRRLIMRRARPTVGVVRRQLAAANVIAVDSRRLFGLVPVQQLTVHDPVAVAALRARLHAALYGDLPVEHIDPGDAALLALAAGGGLRTVLPWRDRRRYADRLTACGARAGGDVARIQRALAQLRTARHSSG